MHLELLLAATILGRFPAHLYPGYKVAISSYMVATRKFSTAPLVQSTTS